MCSTAPTSTYTHTQRQTDRKEKDEGKKTEKESERKGQGQIGGREERTPPCLLHTRDSGALVTSCLFKWADCIVITDWLKPFSFLSVCFFPPRFFFTHCPFLFCFYKQQKGRQSFIKTGDILPLAVKKSSLPASPHPTVWMGRSHKLGGSHRITLPGLSSPAPPQPPSLPPQSHHSWKVGKDLLNIQANAYMSFTCDSVQIDIAEMSSSDENTLCLILSEMLFLWYIMGS